MLCSEVVPLRLETSCSSKENESSFQRGKPSLPGSREKPAKKKIDQGDPRPSNLTWLSITMNKSNSNSTNISNISSSTTATTAPSTPLYSRDDLKKRLTPLQYQVTQEKGTERAFTGKYYKCKDDGLYGCIVCGEEIFSSETKYESGSGWPAFYDVLHHSKVKLKQDASHVGGNILLIAMKPGIVRTCVSCARCGAHLGHVFDDGPKPTGKRFCINSSALSFKSASTEDVSATNNRIGISQ